MIDLDDVIALSLDERRQREARIRAALAPIREGLPELRSLDLSEMFDAVKYLTSRQIAAAGEDYIATGEISIYAWVALVEYLRRFRHVVAMARWYRPSAPLDEAPLVEQDEEPFYQYTEAP